MREKIILIIASLCAGIMIMILHELPKAMLYYFSQSKINIETKKEEKTPNNVPEQKIWKLHNYIDPIGLLLCVTLHVGFSKPYYYRIRYKKLSKMLGTVGLLSLLIQFLTSCAVLRFVFHMDSRLLIPMNATFLHEFLIYFISIYAIISLSMLITNLFPILAFDMGLFVAASSPLKFYSIIRMDYLVKMVWLFTVLVGVINSITEIIFNLFLG